MTTQQAADRVIDTLFGNLAVYRAALGDVDSRSVAGPLRKALGYQHDRLLHALVALTRNPDIRDRTDLSHDLLKAPTTKSTGPQRYVTRTKDYGLERGQLLQHVDEPSKWQAKVFLGRLTGRKRYVSRCVTGTADDAIGVLNDLLAEADEGELAPIDRATTFGAYLRDRWLPVKRGEVEHHTWKNYVDAAEAWIIPTLGTYTVSGVTTSAISRLVAGLRRGTLAKKGQPLSATSLGVTYTIMKQALDLAVRDRLIRHNPAASVPHPGRG